MPKTNQRKPEVRHTYRKFPPPPPPKADAPLCEGDTYNPSRRYDVEEAVRHSALPPLPKTVWRELQNRTFVKGQNRWLVQVNTEELARVLKKSAKTIRRAIAVLSVAELMGVYDMCFKNGWQIANQYYFRWKELEKVNGHWRFKKAISLPKPTPTARYKMPEEIARKAAAKRLAGAGKKATQPGTSLPEITTSDPAPATQPVSVTFLDSPTPDPKLDAATRYEVGLTSQSNARSDAAFAAHEK